MKRRILAAVIAALLGALTLAGCASQGNSGTQLGCSDWDYSNQNCKV